MEKYTEHGATSRHRNSDGGGTMRKQNAAAKDIRGLLHQGMVNRHSKRPTERAEGGSTPGTIPQAEIGAQHMAEPLGTSSVWWPLSNAYLCHQPAAASPAT